MRREALYLKDIMEVARSVAQLLTVRIHSPK
jgi:hypothetical protein